MRRPKAVAPSAVDSPQRARALAKPLRFALLSQALACVLVVLLLPFLPIPLHAALPLALLQGLCALLLSWGLRMPSWWLWIGFLFVPLVVLLQALALPPWVWLAGFILLALVFWRTDASRVPLYMSNATTAQAVAALLPARPCRLIDLGCGDGSLLRALARMRPDCAFVGYEHAPLPWAWAWLGARRQPQVQIRLGSFWPHALCDYDLVYAFLSPSPMARLWDKARAEMRPDALLVSNSFAVPGEVPDALQTVEDRRATQLYRYHPGRGHATVARGGST